MSRREHQHTPDKAKGTSLLVEGRSTNAHLRRGRMDALQGTQVGEWTLQRLLGKGGMSIVYEGVHTQREEHAAIKLLRPGLLDDEAHLHRFQREAETLYKLKHPHIVGIYEFGCDPHSGYFMALERLVGEDLGSILARGPVPLGWLLPLVEQICDALQKAHGEGIIHRDLKPANIFLEAGEEGPKVKLLDFGIAKIQHVQDDARLTSTGAILGTPAYLAPEQIKSQEMLTPTTDLYALGVILYEALTGKLPIDGDAGFDHLLRVVQATPKPLGAHREDLVDTEIEDVIMRMLAKDPRQRPGSLEICWHELEIASQFFEDPLDLPEHYPVIGDQSIALELSSSSRVAGAPLQPLFFSTDGEQVSHIQQPSPKLATADARTSGDTLTADADASLQAALGPPRPHTSEPSRKRPWQLVGGVILFLGIGGLAWYFTQPNQTTSKKLATPAPLQQPLTKDAGNEALSNTLLAPRQGATSKVLSAERLLQQARALRHYQQSHLALQAAKRAGKAGAYGKASTHSAEFLKQWQLFRKLDAGGVAHRLASSPKTHQATFARWRALALQAKRAEQHHTRAEFRRAAKARKAFLARLGKDPQRKRYQRDFAKQRAREAKGKAALTRAHRAYRKKRWKQAYNTYLRYLRYFPKAWNRRAIKRRRKGCSCILKIKPWEICTPANYPRHWKKGQP